MKKIKLVVSAIALTGLCYAQNTFKTNGNNLSNGDFLGSNNNQDLDFKTNGQLRLKVNSNGKITAKDNLTVQGVMKADSLVSNGGVYITGLLKVGDALVSGSATSPIVHDFQTTTTGNMILGNADPYIAGPLPISAFRLGIGTQIPQYKVHIGEATNANNLILITNSSTGASATDGLRIGILGGGGVAEIRQQEAQPLNFYTSNLQRATILANGRFGVNSIAPANRVVVTSSVTDPGGGSALTPGGSSGVRTTNMTSATPTLTGNGKVVTVNANGDFYLTNDGGGTATVSATCKNGLNNTVGAPDIEMGGPLIRNTNVTFNGLNQAWNGTGLGQFCVTDYAPATTGFNYDAGFLTGDYKSGIFNLNYPTSLRVDNYKPTPPTANQYGINLTVDSDNPFANYGSYNIVVGDGGGQRTGVFTYADARNQDGAIDVWGIYAHGGKGINNYGGYFEAINASTNSNSKAIAGQFFAQGGSINTYGGFFTATGNLVGLSGAGDNRGIYTTAYDVTNTAAYNTGIYSYANITTTGKNHAVLGIAQNGNTSVGVAGIIGLNNSGLFYTPVGAQIGVYGYNPGGAAAGNWAGYFDGDVQFNGFVYGSQFGWTSDQMFKTNIDSISNAIAIIKQLKPKTFYYDTTNTYKMNFSSKKQYGFIAQDVQTILPELVDNATKPAKKDSTGNITEPAVNYKTLNYNAFFALLMKGMQEQDKRMDSLVAAMASSSRVINPSNNPNNSTSNPTKNANQTPVELSDKNIISLDNSIPNPWVDNTSINYNIPTSFGYAQIIFSTSDGRIIKTVDIKEKGQGTLNVYAKDLSGGLYNYSLVVDGKVIDTKKMVKQ